MGDIEKEDIIKKLFVLLVAVIALGACGGSGGGGGGGGSDSTEPVITDMFLIKFGDPNEVPLLTAEVGSYSMILFCFCDEDLDTNSVKISFYNPIDAALPVRIIEGNLRQTRKCGYWYWGPVVFDDPVGEYTVRLELGDAKGNESLPYDITLIVTDTNTNFNYMWEEQPVMKLWEEK